MADYNAGRPHPYPLPIAMERGTKSGRRNARGRGGGGQEVYVSLRDAGDLEPIALFGETVIAAMGGS